MKWTQQQEKAIGTKGSDILISAAAGSGKTAVLTERIRRLIMEDGISVENMLIVTFSNAAAAEMKEKIIRALKKAAEESQGDTTALRSQIRHARRADISTFHKFSMGIIRRYFYLTDVDQNFGICDEGRRAVFLEEALDELLEERFEDDSENSMFRRFLRQYADVRSEDAVRDMILQVYRFIMSMPDPFEWLDQAADAAGLSEEEFRKTPVYAALRKENLRAAGRAYDLYERVMQDLDGLPALEKKAASDLENIARVMEMAERGSDQELAAALDFKFEVFRASKEEKEAYAGIKERVGAQREAVKKILSGLKDNVCSVSVKDSVKRINDTQEAARYLAELVKDFHGRFTEKKREKNLLDFNDIEHIALEILRNDEIAREYQRHFEVIFIDEYQDSSILQETLIQRISRGNNVYMVGDVKQSIYKFRLAEPEIFIAKYNDFRDGTRPGMRIDLNRNFRSKGNIIRSVNAVFRNIMNRDTCGIDYDEDAELKKGDDYEGKLDRITSLHLINTDIPEDLAGIDEDILELKKTELEAKVTAELASERIGMEIFDKKADKVRRVEPEDIVILLRGTKGQADIYAAALKEEGLPAYVDAGEGYFETTEIEVFMNLLKVIDNRRNDIPLLSVLYSEIFGFSSDELIQIRLTDPLCSFSEAFLRLAEPGEGALQEKCREACGRLEHWRTCSRFMPLETFLWHLMKESGYLDYVTALPGGSRRAANLRALVDKAVDFSASQNKGLFSFLRYVEALSQGSVPMGQALQTENGEKMIRIMTIHKSKGLEFPVVIAAGLGRRFNRDKNTSRVVLHKELGMALQYSDPDGKCTAKTLSQRVIEAQKAREQMAEEMRILYVAMTRPMDELVLVGSLSRLEQCMEKYDNGTAGDPDSAGCYLDWIVPYYREGGMELILHDRQMLSARARAEEAHASRLKADMEAGFPDFADETGMLQEYARRFDFQYPYRGDVLSKSKFSVSGLNRMLREGIVEDREGRSSASEDLSTVPVFMKGEEPLGPAARGTLVHKVLELIPFRSQTSEAEIRQFVMQLPERGFMTEKEAGAVDCEKICSFFQSETGRRACSAMWLRKEWHFTLRKKSQEIAAMAGDPEVRNALADSLSDTVLIQGIIDCCFRDEQGIVIVDYKTDRITGQDRENGFQRLKNEYSVQLKLYREVVERALGEPVEEVILFLLDSGDSVIM